ncbi:LysR substrate-binding domain-containing protein [Neisseriaceae bacterium JH1-16]|nr:LysR substrate-binding domain-containing protein [Neisseriaceae bacterium JH1-16]
MRRLPPLTALKAFEAAARHGHFGRAAEELCVTHSAISHQVRSLEESLSVELFEKRGRLSQLTPAGTRLLGAVQQALDIVADACLDAVQPGMSGVLAVSAPPELAHRLLTRMICEFAERYPEVTVQLLLHDSDAREVNSAADITLLYQLDTTDWSRYRVAPFRAIEFFPVCHPGLLQGEHALRQPRDLLQHCLLHDDLDGKTWASWLGAYAPHQPKPARNLHFAHSGLTIEAALHQGGVALGDVLIAGEELRRGQLVRPFRGAVPSPGNYCLVAEHRKADDPRLAAFLSFAALQPLLCEMNSPIAEI